MPIVIGGLLLGLLPLIFYLITLQNTFKVISPQNRKMVPEQVWLVIIPIFGFIWQFIVVNRMADSLAGEFSDRGIHDDEARPGIKIGLAYCILSCCGIIPVLGYLASIAGLVCWIIYWVKIYNYKTRLKLAEAGSVEILDR